jgi:uncharacterized membrane protein YidH (DUF202 family)
VTAAAALTVMAWRRTALHIALGAVIATRLLVGDFGPEVVLAGLAGLGFAAATMAAASRAHAERGDESPIASAHKRLLATTIAVMVVGVGALAWVVAEATTR